MNSPPAFAGDVEVLVDCPGFSLDCMFFVTDGSLIMDNFRPIKGGRRFQAAVPVGSLPATFVAEWQVDKATQQPCARHFVTQLRHALSRLLSAHALPDQALSPALGPLLFAVACHTIERNMQKKMQAGTEGDASIPVWQQLPLHVSIMATFARELLQAAHQHEPGFAADDLLMRLRAQLIATQHRDYIALASQLAAEVVVDGARTTAPQGVVAARRRSIAL